MKPKTKQKVVKKDRVGDFIQIRWRDSNIYMPQCNKDDHFEVETITSIGYVVSEDEKKIVLAGDVLSTGDIRRVIVIPKENLTNFQ